MLLAAIGSARGAHSQSAGSATAKNAANLIGLHDFDFLVGEWRVDHRTMRVAGTGQWQEFDGWVSNRPLMDGWGTWKTTSSTRRPVSLALSGCASGVLAEVKATGWD
jgi:hypothetical protein